MRQIGKSRELRVWPIFDLSEKTLVQVVGALRVEDVRWMPRAVCPVEVESHAARPWRGRCQLSSRVEDATLLTVTGGLYDVGFFRCLATAACTDNREQQPERVDVRFFCRELRSAGSRFGHIKFVQSSHFRNSRGPARTRSDVGALRVSSNQASPSSLSFGPGVAKPTSK